MWPAMGTDITKYSVICQSIRQDSLAYTNWRREYSMVAHVIPALGDTESEDYHEAKARMDCRIRPYFKTIKKEI